MSMAKNKSRKTSLAPAPTSNQGSSSNSTPALNILSGKRVALLYFFLFALVLAVFLPAVRNDFLYWYGDDPLYVTENLHVKSGLTLENIRWAFSLSADKSSSGVESSNLHPLTWISHMLACEIFGLKAWGHHLVSILLHSANSVLLFIFLRRITGSNWRSLVVALLFGLHPLRVESVAWVSERKDVLSGFFWMLTLLMYARYCARITNHESRITIQRSYSTASLFCFLLAA
jgi:protein O-mannosyl-transferase